MRQALQERGHDGKCLVLLEVGNSRNLPKVVQRVLVTWGAGLHVERGKKEPESVDPVYVFVAAPVLSVPRGERGPWRADEITYVVQSSMWLLMDLRAAFWFR